MKNRDRQGAGSLTVAVLSFGSDPPMVEQSIITVVTWMFLAGLYWLVRRESRTAQAGVAEYADALKWFVRVGWLLTVGGVLFVGLTLRGQDYWAAMGMAGLFAALILILHLEAFFVRVALDGEFLLTSSPWRRDRVIPVSAVTGCDYSPSMQWYRVYTAGYGVVRLHWMMKGIGGLLAALPVQVPKGPSSPGQDAHEMNSGAASTGASAVGRNLEPTPPP
ncbi:hypothetical protein [Alienimonas californiensis]|uniref:Uncharacterized protein n=1 Tax=Alienimonas californiensis TaxID=2527989 RepID=A0A517PAB3_9PLAN|nr:hypothetical protein [Alienimonas californiensis]QDT16320.1 hypothetical protein CA12_24210 [Alienimonas californiensis]